MAMVIAPVAFAPGRALALSAAPNAFATAPASCTNPAPGDTCTTTQPSTPAWLTLANGSPMFTQQTLTGTAADEYGTTASSDASLLANTTPYASAPSVGSDVIGSALANLAGTTDPGDTYAVVLKADRTLEVLGPQSSGYQSAASVTVPGVQTLVGVVALAAPVGSGLAEKIAVVTASSGFYVYDFTPGSPASLTAEASPQPAPLSGPSAADPGVGANPAFTCSSLFGPTSCGSPGASGPWKFAVPAGQHAFAVYEAPPGHGSWSGGATSSFAIAYTTVVSGEYTIDMFAYESDGLHLIHEKQAFAPTGSVTPFAMRYALFGSDIHLATLSPSTTSGQDTMTTYDTGGAPLISSGHSFTVTNQMSGAGQPQPGRGAGGRRDRQQHHERNVLRAHRHIGLRGRLRQRHPLHRPAHRVPRVHRPPSRRDRQCSGRERRDRRRPGPLNDRRARHQHRLPVRRVPEPVRGTPDA